MEIEKINRIIINYLVPFSPERIGIFGSYARNEASESSDIDILVKFKNTISLLELVRIHRELSEATGRNVDIVTEPSLKNEKVKKSIYKDLKIIYK